ncbi:MAG: adenylate/guanylate cyclase domain-containing protein, partial [Spirochaetia bacterium]|nr:adenylate/guanylate cyclase domain-containing protein [Spirochaetia bacterium]
IIILIWRGRNRIAAILIGFITGLHIGLLSLYFLKTESGMHYYLIAIAALSFLLLSEKDKFWLIFINIFCVTFFAYIEYSGVKSKYIIQLPNEYYIWFHRASTIGMSVITCGTIFIFFQETKKVNQKLQKERDRSEELLLNILPLHVADQLKVEQKVIAESFSNVSILFADMVGFSKLSADKSPEWLVDMLNDYFHAFDDLVVAHNVEKIKTIGDAYMVASGIPVTAENHAEKMIYLAKDMLKTSKEINEKNNYQIEMRVGISSGSVIAGVLGHKKFVYDVWGDTVNVASRMESNGIPGRIQVSESTYNQSKILFDFDYRGILEIKGKGKMKLFLLKHND